MADENKFINATAFDKTLCNMIRNICSGSCNRQVGDGVCLALDQLRAAPAANAVEVVHGRWIPLEYDGYADGNPVWDLWECSECGEEHSGDEDTLTPYCPNCGAKMDGGNDK